MANQNRSNYQSTVGTLAPDNTTEEISPADLRALLENLSDSAVFKIDDFYLRPAGDSAGTQPAYELTLTNRYASVYSENMPILFQAHSTNTGAATINVNAIGAKNLRRPDGSATQAGDIVSGQLYIINYDSGNDEFLIVPGFGGATAAGGQRSPFDHITGSGTVTISGTRKNQLIKSGVTQVNFPASPTDGENYRLKNVSGAQATISGNGKNLYTWQSVATTTINNNVTQEYVYDASDDLWYNVQ